MKRIVVTGAESTGKSTLAAALGRELEAPVTNEFVRDYVAALGRPLAGSDLEPIARGQLAAEDAHSADSPARVVHDTNLLSSIVYARHYFDTTIDWVDRAFAERDYALYLLCLPDIPWVADAGQRESPEARERLHALFEAELLQRGLPFVRIGGGGEARLARALEAVREITGGG